MMTFKQLHDISGVPEGDMRQVFMALGADLIEVGTMTLASFGGKPISPDRVLAVLLFHWMTRSGHARDHSLSVITYFRTQLKTLGDDLASADNSWEGPLNVVMIQDGQYVTGEWDVPAFDFTELKTVERSDLPLPVMFQGLSLVGAYLRTISTIQSQPAEAASSGSD